MITRSRFERILAEVRAAGVSEQLDPLLRKTPRGRKRALDVDVFITAAILTAMDSASLTEVNIHETLTKRLANNAQRAHGIRRRDREGADQQLTIRQVRYLFDAIEMNLAHTNGWGVPHDEVADRAENYQMLTDRILSASLPPNLPPTEAGALDGTAIETWAKGKRRQGTHGPENSNSTKKTSRNSKNIASPLPDDDHDDELDDDLDDGPVLGPPAPACTRSAGISRPRGQEHPNGSYSFDPDARWGYRTQTYNNRSDRVFGYEMHSLVDVPAAGQDPDAIPKLLRAFTLTPASTDLVEPSLDLLDRVAAQGRPIRDLLADQAYSYKSVERWADQLRDRGITAVLDIHPKDHGARDFHGTKMIDGVPHCPATPAHLENIARPANLKIEELSENATRKERREHQARIKALREFRAKIAERRVWAFRRVASANSKGVERWECPAQAGKLICANCPLSADYPADRPTVADPPDLSIVAEKINDRPNPELRCCRSRTMSVPLEANGKLRQELYWGSDEWIGAYNRRTYVEGWFGTLKNTELTRVVRGFCRVVGLVKVGILLACASAATNINRLRSWAARVGNTSIELAQPDPPSHGFEEVGADGQILAEPGAPPGT